MVGVKRPRGGRKEHVHIGSTNAEAGAKSGNRGWGGDADVPYTCTLHLQLARSTLRRDMWIRWHVPQVLGWWWVCPQLRGWFCVDGGTQIPRPGGPEVRRSGRQAGPQELELGCMAAPFGANWTNQISARVQD